MDIGILKALGMSTSGRKPVGVQIPLSAIIQLLQILSNHEKKRLNGLSSV